MTEEIDGKRYSAEDLEAIRKDQLKTLEGDPQNWSAMGELLCADCLLCEEYVKDLGPAWKNYALCVEIQRYGQRLQLDAKIEKDDEDSELAAMGIDDDSAEWWQLSKNIIAADAKAHSPRRLRHRMALPCRDEPASNV